MGEMRERAGASESVVILPSDFSLPPGPGNMSAVNAFRRGVFRARRYDGYTESPDVYGAVGPERVEPYIGTAVVPPATALDLRVV